MNLYEINLWNQARADLHLHKDIILSYYVTNTINLWHKLSGCFEIRPKYLNVDSILDMDFYRNNKGDVKHSLAPLLYFKIIDSVMDKDKI